MTTQYIKDDTEYKVLDRKFRWTVIDRACGYALLESQYGDEAPYLMVREKNEIDEYVAPSGNKYPLIMGESYETYDSIYSTMDDYDLPIISNIRLIN